jgi:hypothetical protein
MAYLAPAYLTEIGATAPATGFAVYAVSYPDKEGNRRLRRFDHATPRATLRRLGSLVDSGRGKLAKRDDMAVFAMNPAGETLSYYDIKRML